MRGEQRRIAVGAGGGSERGVGGYLRRGDVGVDGVGMFVEMGEGFVEFPLVAGGEVRIVIK